MLLQRVGYGAQAMTARQALELATLGGASVLNRDDIGALKPGMAADFASFHLSGIDMAGAHWDPVASLIFMGPHKACHTFVQGKAIVRDGQITGVDLGVEIETHDRLSRQLALR